MSNKKYDFAEILKEYNKKYKRDYELPPKAFDIVIVHTGTNTFNVTYCDESRQRKEKKPLQEFIYYHIDTQLICKKFITFILSKEEKSLNLKIEILPASKIRYAYLHNNYYAPGVGSLGKSCMRHKENQKSLSFYIKNNAKIVVLIDDNHKIHARALLWDNIKSTQRKSTFTYLDRVYANSERHESLFSKLAKENKWKYYDSANGTRTNYYKDNINIINMCHFPYTDTFRFLYYKDNLVSSGVGPNITSLLKHSDTYVSLTQTGNGGYIPSLDPNRVREVLSGNYISKKDAVLVKRYDGYVLKKNIANIKGTYYSIFDNLVIKITAGGYILKENSTVEVKTNNTIDKSEAIKSDKYKGYIHKSNVVYIRDEVYHKLDPDIICFDNKWYHISQCFINYNRKEVNKELAKQSTFVYKDLPETWQPYKTVTREGDLVPKEHTIIVYNLVHNPMSNNIEYQEVYLTDKSDGLNIIKLTTGEFIINSSENKKCLKKFNNKWCIKQKFEAPNKKQLTLF